MAGGLLGKAKIGEFQDGIGPFGGVQEVLGLQREAEKQHSCMKATRGQKGKDDFPPSSPTAICRAPVICTPSAMTSSLPSRSLEIRSY